MILGGILIAGADGACNRQALERCAVDVSERCAVVGCRRCAERQRVSAAVEGSAELVGVGAVHL